jgi:hypothetical protein
MRKSVTAIAASLTLLVAGCDDSGAETQPTSQAAPPVTATTPTPTPTTEAAPETTVVPEAEPTPTEGPRTKVPKALVGTWDGDRAQISFSRAGDVTFSFKKGGSASGTVVIDGSSMTLHLSSGVVAVDHWEISRFDAGYGYEFFNLTLDGTSYVRDVPK